jgi:hypothetical protein
VHLKKGVVLALFAETAAWYIKAQHGHLIFVLVLAGVPYLVGAISLLEMERATVHESKHRRCDAIPAQANGPDRTAGRSNGLGRMERMSKG